MDPVHFTAFKSKADHHLQMLFGDADVVIPVGFHVQDPHTASGDALSEEGILPLRPGHPLTALLRGKPLLAGLLVDQGAGLGKLSLQLPTALDGAVANDKGIALITHIAIKMLIHILHK